MINTLVVSDLRRSRIEARLHKTTYCSVCFNVCAWFCCCARSYCNAFSFARYDTLDLLATDDRKLLVSYIDSSLHYLESTSTRA